jgi:cobaltochelatase CobN
MRTGGDEIAQALAFLGVRPAWDQGTGRVSGFEIMPVGILGRPRVDVTLRISGFFRDAFPALIDLFDSAARAVAALQESADDNPLAAQARLDQARLAANGAAPAEALRQAAIRIFGAKPGAYGAGLQALIDSGAWESETVLADAYLAWGAYAYGGGAAGEPARALFEARIGALDAIVQNQDNREHDLLDSDDYYQFEGGLAVTAHVLSGKRPTQYHNDHSNPERPLIQTLEQEIGRIVRARATNPKWLEGVMRHGYKGAFEIAATVDYLFAFAATTNAVHGDQFEALYAAYLANERVRGFMAAHNPAALAEMAERFLVAVRRGFWRPRANEASALLAQLAGGHSVPS